MAESRTSYWATQFLKSTTTEMPFHSTANLTVPVPMMRQTNAFRYWEDQAVQALVMPYEGNDISMLIVLPRRIDGLASVEQRMTVGDIRGWADEGSRTRVAVSLPRF
jgi:serpin B